MFFRWFSIPEFKPAFIERSKELLKDEYKTYLEWLLKPLNNCIRTNTLKISNKKLVNKLSKKWELKKVPFCEIAHWVSSKQIGNSLEHYLGYFYVQEAASLIPPLILKPKPYDLVLDMAAAPGSKTTQISGLLDNKGVIIANDVRIPRIKALRMNLQRCGVLNTIVTMNDGRTFGKRGEVFDKVLLDAPCSAEGAIRKNYKIINEWHENIVKKLSFIQKGLITSAFKSLRPGGYLTYSTCTLSPEEDEGVVDFLINKFDNARIIKEKLKGLKSRPGITNWRNKEYDKNVKNCLRVYPQDNDTEGFFIAKVMKE